MRALQNRVHAKDPKWRLAGFIVDHPLADVLAIREVFECSVLVCVWRVRHAWHNNLLKRCSETEACAEITKWLSESVNKICKESVTVDLFNDFAATTDFMDYFKAIWYPRLGAWTSALKTFPIASLETCAAMELYHNQLKLRLLNEKDKSVYQSADWPVNKLGTKVHSYFWLDEHSGKDDFARYWKDEWLSGLTAWQKSLKILDSNIVMEGKCAKVIDQEDQNTTHMVCNPGSEYAICDCSWAKMGNICEHVFKMIKFCRNTGTIMPSISMFQYNKALIDMLRCLSFDSLIRDYSVCQAFWLKMQLNSQIGLPSCQFKVNSKEQQNRTLVDEDHCPNKTLSSQIENGPAVKYKHLLSNDFGRNVTHFVTNDAEMEVDSPFICTLKSQLVVDRVESKGFFSQKAKCRYQKDLAIFLEARDSNA